jgi:hypothetical protein
MHRKKLMRRSVPDRRAEASFMRWSNSVRRVR